jgi:hypothetical protein
MFGRTSVLSSLVALVLFSASAEAASVQITNPYTNMLSASAGVSQGTLAPGGDVFELRPDQSVLAGASFTNIYKFDVNPTAVEGDVLLNVHVVPPNGIFGGVANLAAQWFTTGGVALSGIFQITDASGLFVPPATDGYHWLFPGIPVGDAYLQVTGSRIGDNGRYDFDLSAVATPLPSAVFLFGSVLAGGVGGLQLMRRRRVTHAA